MIKQGDLIEYVGNWQTLGTSAGKVDGLTVFVEQTLVGERATVRITHVNAKKGVAYGKVVALTEISADRQTPPCKHFGKCGGCSLQHMVYSRQLQTKASLVESNLKKLAGLDYPVTVTPSPCALGYRNKLSLPVGVKNGKLFVGMFQKESHVVVPVPNCLLGGEWSQKLVTLFQNYANSANLSAYNEQTFAGEIRHLVARFVENQLLVTVVATSACKHNFAPLLQQLQQQFNGNVGLFVNVNDNRNNVILGKKTHYVDGLHYISGKHFGVEFRLRPESFFQVNDDVKDMLYGRVKELLNTTNTQVLVDLFSGIGILTCALASSRYHTYAVEIEPSAVKDADEMVALNGIATVTNICGDAEKELPKILAQNKGKQMSLVVDPPRKGLGESICNAVCDGNFDNVVYISCDSATLARDLKNLERTYKLTHIECFDMFPQTDNVETLVCLERR